MGWDIDGPPAGLRGAFRIEADARLAAASPVIGRAEDNAGQRNDSDMASVHGALARGEA